MLLLTDNARQTIESILAGTEDPHSAGLRISSSATEPNALALAVSPAPTEGDTVVADSGARVFLAPVAKELLEDKVLDTEAQGDGAVRFRITVQA